MSRKVFIITRCTDLSMKESALLTFKTIRVGFPTWDISCIYLGDFAEVEESVRNYCYDLQITLFTHYTFKTNNEAIEFLTITGKEDFVVVDSDMVFHKSLEWYEPTALLAGRHVPEYYDDYVKATTKERLHSSLLYFTHLQAIRDLTNNYFPQNGRFTPYNVFNPVVVTQKGSHIFYDTCSILFNLISGEAFGSDVLECYDHLLAGSFYKDVVKELGVPSNTWEGAFANPSSIKGIYKQQRIHWYKSGFKLLEEKYTNKLSEDAQRFLYGFGKYVGAIDDLIDEPNNPELVDKTTALAAKLFTSNFWSKYGRELLVVEQLVHVIYFAQLPWETAQESWKRRDARVLSHCGYYMIIAVLLVETNDTELAKNFARELMEINHAEHLEDLTTEEIKS